MINLLLALLLSGSSGQPIPNATNVPTPQPVLSKTGPRLMDNIPSQTVSLGIEETYTIAANKYFYAPDNDMLSIGEIKFYQESNMESHSWLSFDQPHSTLIMSPSEKKDIGDHELIITAVNSIGQNASQIMTIHVIYNPEEGCGTNFDSEWYAWAIPSIIAIAAVPTCLYQALVAKKQKKIADIEKRAYEGYLTEKKLKQVLEDIGKGSDQYYFQLCFCHCCKVSAYDISSIRSKVAIKLYLMLKETMGWKEISNDEYRLDEKKRASFALALSVNEQIIPKMKKMSGDHRLNTTEELKKEYFPEMPKRSKKKERKNLARRQRKYRPLSTIKETTPDNADERASLTEKDKSDKEAKEHIFIPIKRDNEY